MSGVTTADSAARADWIGCEPSARTSAVPRMRKVDVATPLRLILRKRDLMIVSVQTIQNYNAATSARRGSRCSIYARGGRPLLGLIRTEYAHREPFGFRPIDDPTFRQVPSFQFSTPSVARKPQQRRIFGSGADPIDVCDQSRIPCSQ